MSVGKVHQIAFRGLCTTTKTTTVGCIAPTSEKEDSTILERMKNLKPSDIIPNDFGTRISDSDHNCHYLENLETLEFSTKPVAPEFVEKRYAVSSNLLEQTTLTIEKSTVTRSVTEISGRQVKAAFEHLMRITKNIATRG